VLVLNREIATELLPAVERLLTPAAASAAEDSS
jgi:hypothetical protein